MVGWTVYFLWDVRQCESGPRLFKGLFDLWVLLRSLPSTTQGNLNPVTSFCQAASALFSWTTHSGGKKIIRSILHKRLCGKVAGPPACQRASASSSPRRLSHLASGPPALIKTLNQKPIWRQRPWSRINSRATPKIPAHSTSTSWLGLGG